MTRMVIVLSQNYADWECALLSAVVRSYFNVSVQTASPDGKQVISSGGFRVTPDLSLADIDPAQIDCLVLNGGTAWESDTPPDVSELVKRMAALKKPIAAICAATQALAGAGLLDDIAHTGNSADELNGVAGYRGQDHFVAQPASVTGGTIVTAPGTAPVSFMKSVCAVLGFGGAEMDYYIGFHGAEHALL